MQYVTNEREKKVLSTVKDNTFFLRYMYTPKKKKIPKQTHKLQTNAYVWKNYACWENHAKQPSSP